MDGGSFCATLISGKCLYIVFSPVAWPVASVFLGRTARVCFAALGFLLSSFWVSPSPAASRMSPSPCRSFSISSRWRSSTHPALAPKTFGFWFLGLWCKDSLTPPTGVKVIRVFCGVGVWELQGGVCDQDPGCSPRMRGPAQDRHPRVFRGDSHVLAHRGATGALRGPAPGSSRLPPLRAKF